MKTKANQGNDYRTLLAGCCCWLLLVIPIGCSLGPRTVRWERTEYNLAIQETEETQLLLNLVRLKYRDTPIFLELSTITSQYSFETGLGTGDEGIAEVPLSSGLKGRFGPSLKLGPTLKYSTQPTVTYTPFQGEKFANQLLAPMRIEMLVLLYRSGWPLHRVLTLGVQRMNGVRNAVRASGPTPGRAPEYASFRRVVDIMVQMNHEDLLDIVHETVPAASDRVRTALQLRPKAHTLSRTKELLSLLNLVPDRTHYPITYAVVEHGTAAKLDHVEVEPRSLLGLLFFLSQSVEVPAGDVKAGLVTTTSTADGSPFDWRGATGGMLQVRSSPSRPERASVGVRYRGVWFYIDDTDLKSKSTFAFVAQLVALQSGEPKRLLPTVAVPIGPR